MILTVKILTGSPETWVEVQASDVVLVKQCRRCDRTFDTDIKAKAYCSDECKWNAQHDRRAISATRP